jgi:hypothetical protein
MTSIKPPATGATGAPQLGEIATSPNTGETKFEQTLEGARAAHSTGATTATGATGATNATHQTGETAAPSELAAQRGSDPVAALLREIESGQLGMEQAVERLLDQTLERVGTQLSGVQRAELSGLLRDALAHDPTLRALRDDGS